MDQSLAIWILIVLSLGTASLPFVAQRPFVALPWQLPGEPPRAAWLRVAESLVFFVLLAGLCRLALYLIGGALLVGGDGASAALFLGRLFVVFLAAALLLAYPGWRSRGHVLRKPFIVRLVEVLVLYLLVGTLGFAFEANIGNVFPQGWEFYAVTLCLYLVLAYPGFVYRYLLRRRS